jgi:hypothetical protein
MRRLTNFIFNLQFQIPSLLQSVLKFSISDFAFFMSCWEKLFDFLNSRGPPGVRGPQVNNGCNILLEILITSLLCAKYEITASVQVHNM